MPDIKDTTAVAPGAQAPQNRRGNRRGEMTQQNETEGAKLPNDHNNRSGRKGKKNNSPPKNDDLSPQKPQQNLEVHVTNREPQSDEDAYKVPSTASSERASTPGAAAEGDATPGVGAKVAGLATRAAAAVSHAINSTAESLRYATGTLNAVDMLMQHHRETESMLSKIETTADPASRRILLESMCDGLVAHMRIEEEIFYSATLTEGKRSQSEVNQSEKEHKEVKELITELLQLNPADAAFNEKFTLLGNTLEHHIKEEESFFPKIREDITEQRLRELGKEMHKSYAQFMGHDQPRSMAFQDVGKPEPTTETQEQPTQQAAPPS